jgi:glycosyltransferase involved in cell wall biosynthesis
MATLLWVLEPALGRRIVADNPAVGDAFARAGRIVFVAGSQPERIYRDFLPRPNWEVIELGIELPETLAPRPPRRHRRLDLVLVSTLERRKGQHVALHALAALADDGIRLTLVGDRTRHAGYVRELERFLASQPALAARIAIVGPVAPEAALAHYRAADAALFPTLDDNIPTALIEAMGEGCPVIASALAPIAEAVGDAALLVPPGDAAALAAAIGRLRDDPALGARLARDGAARVRARYDLPRHLARMEDAIARAVAAR